MINSPTAPTICSALIIVAIACSANTPDDPPRSGSPDSPTLHRALAYGDFDGNGSPDWAAGFAENNVDCSAGKVGIWYQGFDPGHPSDTWDFGDADGPDPCDANFGAALAIGDFNADGYADLAAGAPGDIVSGNASAGSVRVRYGSAERLSTAGERVFNQDGSEAEVNDAFGTALASGDFNCDAYPDLAIGVPGEDGDQTAADVGAVQILFGGPEGLSGSQSQFIRDAQNAGAGDWHFGSFLAAGNLNGDIGCDDLVIGIPDHDILSVTAAGSIAVLYGSEDGLDTTELETWDQESFGAPGDNESNDQFGRAVWIVDDNNDGYEDLLVYSRGDDSVVLVHGSSEGLNSLDVDWRGPEASVQGWLRDACYWACQLAWALLPPGPDCDCSACEILSQDPPDPCPNCG